MVTMILYYDTNKFTTQENYGNVSFPESMVLW